MDHLTGSTVLWGAVVLAGIYHGLNPGMGWPLAVSAALMGRRGTGVRRPTASATTPAGPGRSGSAGAAGDGRPGPPAAPSAGPRPAATEASPWTALLRAVLALAAGHLLAMLAVLLPFSVLAGLAERSREIRLVTGAIVIAAGLYLLITRRHPRFLSRVPPTRLALWSFLAATAHGAGLMLVPLMLGLDGAGAADGHAGHDMAGMDGGAAGAGSMGTDLLTAGGVALVHTLAMAVAGALVAVVVYRWLGLRFLTRAWFNLDVLWAVSLVLVGGFGIWSALA